MGIRAHPEVEVDRLGLSLSGCDGPLIGAASVLRESAPAAAPAAVQGTLDLEDYFRRFAEGSEDQALLCLRSSRGAVGVQPPGIPQERYLVDLLEELVRREESVLVYLDWLAYGIEESPGAPNARQAHSTCLMLAPDLQGTWRAFHFNPHGQRTENDSTYELYWTRSRMRSLALPCSLDALIVSQLIRCLNDQLDTEVKYGPGRSYNYLGPNLQAGDTRGICYTFPFLLHYMMAIDPSRSLIRAIARGHGGSAITRAACVLMGLHCPRRLDQGAMRQLECHVEANAVRIGRDLPRLLLRVVASLKRKQPLHSARKC